MNKDFNPQLKQKFEQGIEGNKKTPEEMKEENTKLMMQDIEYMRLKDEYEGLKIKAYENAVLLGMMLPSQVPGLLGLELMQKELSVQGWLSNFKEGVEQGMKEEMEKEKLKEQQTKEQSNG